MHVLIMKHFKEELLDWAELDRKTTLCIKEYLNKVADDVVSLVWKDQNID